MVDRINGAAEKKVGRNDPCHCGSQKKYKKCHGAPERQRPACSLYPCKEPVHWFLAPSLDGTPIPDRYWVACREHAKPITQAVAEKGLDVHVVPFDSLAGEEIGEVMPVAGAGAEEAENDEAPDVEPKRIWTPDDEPPPQIWTPPGVL
jgi:hypothetical protein